MCLGYSSKRYKNVLNKLDNNRELCLLLDEILNLLEPSINRDDIYNLFASDVYKRNNYQNALEILIGKNFVNDNKGNLKKTRKGRAFLLLGGFCVEQEKRKLELEYIDAANTVAKFQKRAIWITVGVSVITLVVMIYTAFFNEKDDGYNVQVKNIEINTNKNTKEVKDYIDSSNRDIRDKIDKKANEIKKTISKIEVVHKEKVNQKANDIDTNLNK